MEPFVEIVVWALVLMIIPFSIEALILNRLVEKEKRYYFSIVCGARRGANILIFITLIYLIGNLLLPVLLMLFIEALVGILLYRKILTNISLKVLTIYVLIANVISWAITYSVFKFVFMYLE